MFNPTKNPKANLKFRLYVEVLSPNNTLHCLSLWNGFIHFGKTLHKCWGEHLIFHIFHISVVQCLCSTFDQCSPSLYPSVQGHPERMLKIIKSRTLICFRLWAFWTPSYWPQPPTNSVQCNNNAHLIKKKCGFRVIQWNCYRWRSRQLLRPFWAICHCEMRSGMFPEWKGWLWHFQKCCEKVEWDQKWPK